MKILKVVLAVLLCAPACIARADAVEDAYTAPQAVNQPKVIQAIPNLGIAPARNEVARSSANWDIGLGVGAAVIGVLGLVNAKTAEKDGKDADTKMIGYINSANYFSNWAGWWEGWGDAMEIDYGTYDALTLSARSNQYVNESDYSSAIDSANAQKKIAEEKNREAGLWTGVGYIGLATGAVFIIKGMLTLSEISRSDGRISGTGLRLETSTYPDSTVALAYDF